MRIWSTVPPKFTQATKKALSSQYTLQELFKEKEKYSDRFELNNIATIEEKYPYI